MSNENSPVLFPPGQVLATPGALAELRRIGIMPMVLVRRHLRGDWGDLSDADKQENTLSVTAGYRILSAYDYPDPSGGENVKFWVITEADRSATTILLPEEY